MLKLLLKQLYHLFQKIPKSSSQSASDSTEFSNNLETACAMVSIHIREDGEFAITSEFFNDTDDTAEISGAVLHMLNSGLLADYFLKSLHLWGNHNEQQTTFVLKIIKIWKARFDNNEIESEKMSDHNNTESSYKLAVDPSDVFGLKGLSKGQ